MGFRITIPYPEFFFETSRAQGPGGQNVNKVETKVRLLWNPATSSALTDAQRERLLRAPTISRKINTDGFLVVESQAHRTQRLNREDAIKKLHALVSTALQPVKKRVPTKPTKGAKIRKKIQKERRSATKALRKSLFE